MALTPQQRATGLDKAQEVADTTGASTEGQVQQVLDIVSDGSVVPHPAETGTTE